MSCEAWPQEKHGYTQALAVNDAMGAAHIRMGWPWLAPPVIAEVAAHDVRSGNWHGPKEAVTA